MIDLVSMREAMERLFDDRFFRPLWVNETEREIAPALDVFTTAESVVAKAALPGVKPEDVEITIADDLVTISGTFKEEKETTEVGYTHKELSRGSFQRAFAVPTALKAEEAKAVFKDGLLTLTIPRAEEVKPKHVKVEAS
jgi:HSP20 family protein